EGSVLDNVYQDYHLQTNLNHKVSSAFQLGAKIGISTQINNALCQDGNYVNCPISAAYFEPPISYPYLEDDSYSPYTAFGITNNLAVLKNEVDRETNTLRLLGNLNGTYTVTEWLSIKGLIGMDYRNNRDKRFESIIANPSSGGNAREYLSTTANFNAQLTANFVKTFNDVHAIDGFVGAEYRRDYDRFFGTRGDGIAAGFNVIDA